MIDLTGANLVAYILRVVQDAVIRNPRFRNTLGVVTFASNNQINYGDTQILVKSVTTSGTRLSPDYFMCTQHGRAILCKVGDKDGSFVEWVTENDKTRLTPKAGVYYFNVDAVDEQTRNVNLTVQQFRWEQGSFKNAEGTIIGLAPGIDGNALSAFDSANSNSIVNFVVSGQQLRLLTPTKRLVLKVTAFSHLWQASHTFAIGDIINDAQGGTPHLQQVVSIGASPHQTGASLPVFDQAASTTTDGNITWQDIGIVPQSVLVPNTDYWILRKQDTVVLQSAVGGQEIISVPTNVTAVTFIDQDGYELRKDNDYAFQGPGFILLSAFTPKGATISARGTFKLDPSTNDATNPENVISLNIGANESLASGQVTISATSGDYNSAAPDPLTGNITLPVLLLPGEYFRFEVRILTGNYTIVGKKYELNGFKKTRFDATAGAPDANTPGPGAYVLDLDANGLPVDPIPGMVLAIGDSVVKGDQCAVIVNPELTETYEVFGSKENLTFQLECKSNDYQTSSDISELLKRELLIMRRENMEADGITIFEATRENLGEQRDPSGTAPRHIFTVSVTASADWKVFVPCVTRMVSFEINENIYLDDFPGKLLAVPRMQAFGAFTFIPAYA